ncbi:MAG: helix-turn-helix transcriptional regulator [Coprococcus sp.]|nr:helix-turn-helix transcriptional regulator [Coprococcus sp.]
MSKKATKALNNKYYVARYNASKKDESFTSREKTAEILNIDRTRLSRIELGTVVPYPEEVLAMSKAYDLPELCNIYCSSECPIGRETIKPINADSLDRLILQFLGSSQKMEDITTQLIDLTEDGMVDETEIAKFDAVLVELEKMSVNIQSLMLWAKKNKDSINNSKK